MSLLCIFGHAWNGCECKRQNCFSDRHQWGDERFAPYSKCEQITTCSKCLRSKTVQWNHSWNEWERQKSLCQQSRTCTKCLTVETQKGHIWGQWTYTTQEERYHRFNYDGAMCKPKMRICQICKLIEEQPCDHPKGGQVCMYCDKQLDPFMSVS